MDTSNGSSDRRRYPRVRLRLPIGQVKQGRQCPSLMTSDISSGGMYFIAEKGAPAKVGQKMKFELAVPAGEGYWPSSGKVIGQGEIIRARKIGDKSLGVAIKFLTPLSLDFPPVCQA